MEQDAALRSPNTAYSHEIEAHKFRDVASLVGDILENCSNTQLIESEEATVSMVCDVHMIKDLEFGDPREILGLVSKRISIRHDVIPSGKFICDIFRITVDEQLSSVSDRCSLGPRTIRIFCSDDESDGFAAVHVYDVPTYDYDEAPAAEYPALERIIDAQKFAKQLKHDYFNWNRLTKVEFDDMVSLLAEAREWVNRDEQ